MKRALAFVCLFVLLASAMVASPGLALTMAPALVVLAAGVDPTRALVLSQVVLSFGIPFALVPLVLLTRRVDVMGPLVNKPVTTAAAAAYFAVLRREERDR